MGGNSLFRAEILRHLLGIKRDGLLCRAQSITARVGKAVAAGEESNGRKTIPISKSFHLLDASDLYDIAGKIGAAGEIALQRIAMPPCFG